MNSNLELAHDTVYGDPFSRFGETEIRETVANYAARFAANTVDPRPVFEGRKCLDAGCGYGRGSLFMLGNGAAFVDAVDISPTNVDSARRQLTRFGFDNFECHQGSIESLPFENESFDVVWCYGVIHHAANTDACLSELSRVLKVGGRMFLFLYGSGGVFWYSMRRFREILAGVATERCLAAARLMDFSTIEVSNFVDSWKVSFLRCYTQAELGARLAELGFGSPEPWPYGMKYDLNHRRTVHEGDGLWMGEGDLRCLLTKSETARGDGHRLSNTELGSELPFAAEITDRLGPLFDGLGARVAGSPVLAVAACGYVHRALYALLREDKAFDPTAYEEAITTVTALLDEIGRTGVE